MSFKDHLSDFNRYRSAKIKLQKDEAKGILCRGKYTPAKRKAMMKEMERLMKGFADNPGFIKNLAYEIKTPNWQKGERWVEPRKANICYQCKKRFSIISKKINCRIGGQVFCKECGGNDSIVIYLEDKQCEPKWTINGKGRVDKMKVKASFELYAICSGCASDLETILAEDKVISRQNSPSMLSALAVYKSVSKLQRKLDVWLPKYRQEVDTLEGATDITTIDDAKKKRLAKLHLDTYEVLSAVKYRNDTELLKLTPEQEQVHGKIHKRLQKGTFQRYDEHSNQFLDSRDHLIECCPLAIEDLFEVQRESSRKSMESVYIDISQLHDDLSRYTEKFSLDPSLLECMSEIIQSIREEFKPFLRDRESFDKHFEVAMIDRKSRIEISGSLESGSDETNAKLKRIIVVSQCSIIVNGCYYRLEAEVRDMEFPLTKQLLDKTRKKLESATTQGNSYSIPPSC